MEKYARVSRMGGEIGVLAYDCMKDNASFYWFGDDKNIAYCQVELDKRFRLSNVLKWRKTNDLRAKGHSVYRSYMGMTEHCLFYDKGESMTGLEMVDREYIAPRNPFAKELKKARLKKGVSINQVAEYGKFYGNVNHGGSVTNWENGYNIPLKEQWKILCQHLPIERQEYESLRQEYESLRQEYESLRYTFNNQKTHHSVWNYPIAKKQGHITPKPVDLIENILKHSSNEGDVVLDCFMGSGSTGVACKNTNRNFIGIELDENYFNIAEKRINENL